ncbi:TPA: hypothetical protein R8F97_005634 [Pseudomonas putida]|nr:hypothetical protein [Pseudomonas putida]
MNRSYKDELDRIIHSTLSTLQDLANQVSEVRVLGADTELDSYTTKKVKELEALIDFYEGIIRKIKSFNDRYMSVRDQGLRLRELRRRKILWSLAPLVPGDRRAKKFLKWLDHLDYEEQCIYPQALSAGQVSNLVPSESYPNGIPFVRCEEIPQPWRERFLCLNRDSIREREVAYYHDWMKFISEWRKGEAIVEHHRAAWYRDA